MNFPVLYLSMRIVLSCFLFFQLVVVHGEGLKIYTNDGLQGVEDAEGKIVVPAIYQKLGWSNGATDIINKAIGFYENGNWGLINIQAKKVGNAGFRVLKPFNDYLIEAGKVTPYLNVVKRGLIDAKGEVILGLNYYTIEELFPEMYKVSLYTAGDLFYGLVNEDKTLIPLEYETLQKVGEYVVAGDRGLRKQVFRRDGSLLMEDWVDEFRQLGDTYIIGKEGYYGKLDADGSWLEPVAYKSIDQETLVSFPKWGVQYLDHIGESGGELEIGCDSISLDTNNNILIAHVNHAQHILAASNLLFEDQNNTLKSIKNGFLVTKNNKSQKWGIYKTDGREIAYGFDSVAVDSFYFYTQTGGDWDVYNMFGRKINDRPFQEVSFSSNRNVPVKRNDYWGWMDFSGTTILNYTFDQVVKTPNSDYFLAKNYGAWGISDFIGNWLVLAEYDSMYCFDHLYVAERGRASYVIDANGKVIQSIPFEVRPDEHFLNLIDGDKLGLITSAGYYVDPVYEFIQAFGDYYMLKGSAFASLIHTSGRNVLDANDAVEEVFGYSEGYFHILKDGKHGFVDENGKLRIANRYDSAQLYSEGLAPIKLLGKWGFIDQAEVLRIQPFYRYSSTFVNNLAIVQSGEEFGVITPEGEEVVEVKWKKIERLPTGNYKVMDWDDKVGLCDIDGRFIVQPNYQTIEDTDKQLIIASKNGRKGVLDYQGYIKLSFDYREIKIAGEYLIFQKTL